VDFEPNEFAFCTFRNLAVVVWQSRATGPALERLSTVTRGVMREFPEGFSVVHIAKPSAGMPSPEARAGFVKLLQMSTPELACAALLIGGDGFWASSLRGLATGLWLAFPKTFELHLSGDLNELVRWLAPKHQHKTGVRLDPDELARLLRDLSSRSVGPYEPPRTQ
jgi:hypothetical protein